MHDEVMGQKRFWNTQKNRRKHNHTCTHTTGQGKLCPYAFLGRKLSCAHRLIILDTCATCCQSISKGFTVTDLNSRVDARVVASVDGRTYERMENRIPISHHA